ncbi:hypothetical protein DPMN_144918 [Dreissena polymorpha]|uniref:Uncharacterized protein n=1 Tax=Dreissena polymorpha TaxID=45954 RepID=A0A9D4F8W2_DREPO|nr:hypothetical protein DPMN_144918 [Dreissena polymorpha]
MDEMGNTADLITEGDNMAVVAADENDDYFLLKVFPYSQDENKIEQIALFPSMVIGKKYTLSIR